MKRHLTFANVVSLLALFAALGGTSMAAIHLAKDSVGGRAIRDGSVTGKDVKNSSLTRADFRGAVRGRPGPQGAVGPAGKDFGPVTMVESGPVEYNGAARQEAIVTCPVGQQVVGGGGRTSVGHLRVTAPTGSRSGWYVEAVDDEFANPPPVRPVPTVEAFAFCAATR